MWEQIIYTYHPIWYVDYAISIYIKKKIIIEHSVIGRIMLLDSVFYSNETISRVILL